MSLECLIIVILFKIIKYNFSIFFCHDRLLSRPPMSNLFCSISNVRLIVERAKAVVMLHLRRTRYDVPEEKPFSCALAKAVLTKSIDSLTMMRHRSISGVDREDPRWPTCSTIARPSNQHSRRKLALITYYERKKFAINYGAVSARHSESAAPMKLSWRRSERGLEIFWNTQDRNWQCRTIITCFVGPAACYI